MSTVRFSRFPTHRDAEGPNEADGLGVLLRGLRRLWLWHDGAVHAPVAVGCVLQERFRLTALLIMLRNKGVWFKRVLWNTEWAVNVHFARFEKLTCCWGGVQLTSSGSEWKQGQDETRRSYQTPPGVKSGLSAQTGRHKSYMLSGREPVEFRQLLKENKHWSSNWIPLKQGQFFSMKVPLFLACLGKTF